MTTTRRMLASLALGFLFAGLAHAGVGGKSYQALLRINGLGNCEEAKLDFGATGMTLRDCNSFDGTYRELDFFFVGFWSFEGTATQAETGLEGPVIGSGVHVYAAARIHGSGVYQGFDFDLTGFVLPDEPVDNPTPVGAPANACDRPAFDVARSDPRRSPERI